MLSIAALKSASTGEYYEKDDYYFGKGGGEGGEEASALTWGGAGAAELGLTGSASHEDFKAVLEGRNPDPEGLPLSRAEQLERQGKDPGGSEERAAHKPGFDLTFSAPKSVSLAVLLGGDERLLKAHDQAVATAMAFVEKHYAITRIRDGEGGIQSVRTENLLWAQTNHSTSRAGDPQLHTHVVVANATFDPASGQWRALESRSILTNQVLVGHIYRGELAKSAMELGYDVVEHKSGTFELAGFSDRLREAFSKSAARVAANIEREKPETGAAKDAVKLMGRPKKLEVPESELSELWKSESAAIGENVPSIVEARRSREPGSGLNVTERVSGQVSPIATQLADLAQRVGELLGRKVQDPYDYRPAHPLIGRDPEARMAVSYGLQVAEAKSAVFTRSDVLKEAIANAPKGMTVDRLERQFAALQADGRVRQADLHILEGVTTKASLALEAQIIAEMKDGRGRAEPILSLAAGVGRVRSGGLEAAGSAVELTRGQAEAATLILTSPDRVIAVQGAAGAGKSTMFALVGAAAREAGRDMVGLAPTHTAKGELAEKTGFPAQTVQHFIKRYSRLADGRRVPDRHERADWQGKTVVVDEASMLSNADTLALLKIARVLEIEKVVLVGDQRQLGSISAGAPFRYLLDQGVPKAVLDQIVRQRDPELREAVTHFSQGQSTPAVKKMGGRLIEVGRGAGETEMVEKAFDLWREAKDGGVTRPIVAVTQQLREAVNDKILQDLEKRGEIAPLGKDRYRLVPTHLVGPERWAAHKYEVGQVLVFHSRLEASGIAKGEHVTVVGTDSRRQHNLLTVTREDGRTSTINLNSLRRSGEEKFIAYQVREGGALYAGGALVWERTDKARGFFAGQAFTPLGKKDGRLVIRLADGSESSIDREDPQMRFVGPGYAMTTHRSQSLTMQDNPIGLIHSRHATQALAYVQVSRAVHDITVITDDRQLLVQRLGRHDGMNLIASLNVDGAAQPSAHPAQAKTLSSHPGHLGLQQSEPSAPERSEPWDPSLLKPEPEKSFVLDRPYVPEKSL